MIRKMIPGDLTAVARILERSPEAAQWSPSAVPRDLATRPPNADVLVAVEEQDNKIAGIAVVRTVADEAEILNLAVLPAFRRRRLASSLLQAALISASSVGARQAFLEVRESNAIARAFYAQAGFSESGRRRAYYQGPVEDALILSRALD